MIHEQNSVPGLTNRTASRFAAEVFLAFAMARRFFPRRGHLRLSGNPLREQVTSGSASRALRLFRLEENRQTVLVFGGSQGAHSINEALCDALPHFAGRTDVQFLVQTGQDDYDRVVARCRDVEVKLWARRFIADMGDAYALADLVVCRAGAMTISELAACGLPAVLIPYPHAARNHQTRNAEMLAEAGGGGDHRRRPSRRRRAGAHHRRAALRQAPPAGDVGQRAARGAARGGGQGGAAPS